MNTAGKFVIQKHTRQGRPVHWDLMFEAEKGLETYRVGLPPEKLAAEVVTIERIFDHTERFLTYEGPVNQGLGDIRICDSGTYQVMSSDENARVLELQGRILTGRFTLRHIQADSWELSSS